MKKILSVILAVMMLFGALSIGASAEDEVWVKGETTSKQCVVVFDFNGGTSKVGQNVYNPEIGDFVYTNNVTGVYTMLPNAADDMIEGDYIALPSVTPASGWQFIGWYCMKGPDYGVTLSGGTTYFIPKGAAGTVIEFRAAFEPAEVEEDTLTTIMNILIKVFGAIIGILMYGGNTEAGVAMMEKVLGGVLG